LATLKAKTTFMDSMVGDKSVKNWFVWAEERIEDTNPISCNAEDLLRAIAAINESSEPLRDNYDEKETCRESTSKGGGRTIQWSRPFDW
jgi:hypothetical protein